MMSLDDSCPKSLENIRFIELYGEAIIYSPHDSRGHYLNHTAMSIWKYCDGKHTIEDIETKILENFSSTPDRQKVHADIREILIQFREAQLLERYEDVL
jgi:Coenzyme PQQ synthesis protein D (PqqD)